MIPAEALTEPPLSNRGAKWTTDVLQWDWYQATLKDFSEVSFLVSALADGLGVPSRWESCPPLYGYSTGHRLAGVEAGSVQVFARAAGDVHVQATSVAAIPVASVLRARWPDHGVSRADVALDVDEPGSFERLWRLVHGIARDGSHRGRKVKTATAGDWLDGLDGRTLYAGGTSSRLRVVVYEKGKEQTAKDPACGASPDWTRVEWRVRPDSPEQKAWLARATCAEAVGLTPFGADVGSVLLDTLVTVPEAARRFASQDPAYWMARQYPAVLRELLALDPVDAMARLAQLMEQTAPEPARTAPLTSV